MCIRDRLESSHTLAKTLPKISGKRLLTSSLDWSLRLPFTSSNGFVTSLFLLIAGGRTFFIGTKAFEFFSDIDTNFTFLVVLLNQF